MRGREKRRTPGPVQLAPAGPGTDGEFGKFVARAEVGRLDLRAASGAPARQSDLPEIPLQRTALNLGGGTSAASFTLRPRKEGIAAAPLRSAPRGDASAERRRVTGHDAACGCSLPFVLGRDALARRVGFVDARAGVGQVQVGCCNRRFGVPTRARWNAQLSTSSRRPSRRRTRAAVSLARGRRGASSAITRRRTSVGRRAAGSFGSSLRSSLIRRTAPKGRTVRDPFGLPPLGSRRPPR
jgi:hypothetical protein